MVQGLRAHIEGILGQGISDDMFAFMQQLCSEKSFPKKTFLVEAGQRCSEQFFILKGACYSYYLNDKGDRRAIQFAVEGYWITDAASYFSERPASFSIVALEPVRALLLTRENQERLCQEFPLYDRYFRVLLQNTLVHLHERIAKTNSEAACVRYEAFAASSPHFLQRIPQYLIASYLGIAPQSLSRIRRMCNI